MAARALTSPHMSKDSSVTVASRTPLMMGMRDRYTCERMQQWPPGRAELGRPVLTPGGGPTALSSPEGHHLPLCMPVLAGTVTFWGVGQRQMVLRVPEGRAVSLWAPQPCQHPHYINSHKPGLVLTGSTQLLPPTPGSETVSL